MLEQRDWTSVMSRFTEEGRSEESIGAADSNLSNLSIPSRALSRILFALLYTSDKVPPPPTIPDAIYIYQIKSGKIADLVVAEASLNQRDMYNVRHGSITIE